MIKLCIFDLDGTVLDTVGSIAYYANRALEKNGVATIPTEQYKYLAGDGIKNLVRNMLNYVGAYSDELYERVLDDYGTAYNKDVAYKTCIFDGLLPVLDELKSRGIRLTIVSNKPDFAAKTVVRAIYGEGYFDFVVGQREGYPLKPDPLSANEVMERYGVSREECVYVGDTSTDMKTGKNMGVFTVGVLWGFRGKDELVANGADVVIENPSELLGFIN